MKNILIILLILPGILIAQPSIERSVVNSAGSDYKGNNFSLSYSIGETIVSTEETPVITLTQGFQQPDDAVTGIELTESNINVKVYPNPTSEKLVVEILSMVETGSISLSIVDLKGEILYNDKLFEQRKDIVLNKYPAGTYFLIIKSEKLNKKVKIIKY